VRLTLLRKGATCQVW